MSKRQPKLKSINYKREPILEFAFLLLCRNRRLGISWGGSLAAQDWQLREGIIRRFSGDSGEVGRPHSLPPDPTWIHHWCSACVLEVCVHNVLYMESGFLCMCVCTMCIMFKDIKFYNYLKIQNLNCKIEIFRIEFAIPNIKLEI